MLSKCSIVRAHSFCGSASGLEGTEPCALQRELAWPRRWQAPRTTVSGRTGRAAAVGSGGGASSARLPVLRFSWNSLPYVAHRHVPSPWPLDRHREWVEGSSRRRGRSTQDLPAPAEGRTRPRPSTRGGPGAPATVWSPGPPSLGHCPLVLVLGCAGLSDPHIRRLEAF